MQGQAKEFSNMFKNIWKQQAIIDLTDLHSNCATIVLS